MFFAQESQEQVPRSDMLLAKAFGFFGRVSQNAPALVAQRQIHRGWDLLADRGVTLDLSANAFDRSVGAKKVIGKRFVLAQEAQQ